MSKEKPDLHQHLAWFLGPKAENAKLLEDFIVQVIRDYIHWRKNYFPSDPILISKKLKSQLEQEHDLLDTRLNELMAQLRRNFPFYSPRYIAHELSDTMLSATIGYFAGMLFNPNNVTPEAAPVTAELEIDVCNEILTMLGYTPSPPPPPIEVNAKDYYVQKSKEEFGWAHLTSGGTVANIEALWVARQVRYFPLGVKCVAIEKQLNLTIKLPSMTEGIPIQDIDDYSLLLIKPNESIYLLSRYLDALRKAEDLPVNSNLSKLGWQYLEKSKYNITGGFASSFTDYPPVILVAGSRHYSITKAANILGIGQSNIIRVDTDEYFRINVAHLEECLLKAIQEKKVPISVIASSGTTEEGAVDPIHSIVDLRSRLENEHNLSFWLHIDAAWGGFIRSLFCLEPKDEVEALALKISRMVEITPPPITIEKINNSPLKDWHQQFTRRIIEISRKSDKKPKSPVFTNVAEIDESKLVTDQSRETEVEQFNLLTENEEKTNLISEQENEENSRKEFAENINSILSKMGEMLSSNNYERYFQSLIDFPRLFEGRLITPEIGSFKLDLNDIANWVGEFVSTKLNIGKGLVINYPDREVVSAYLNYPKANSITIDPHKMGYAPYPAGCIAFKNDRIRSFILQEAPYITAAEHNALIHLPPRHTDLEDTSGTKPPVIIESFSPFMLEGSKPGAVAAGLWLAYQTAPLTPKRHGLVVRASVLAARSLYEWLIQWNFWCRQIGKEPDYDFIPLTPQRPDTNLVTFIVKPKTKFSITKTNLLTSQVYETFTIQAELGEREYSYSQPFFLSNTKMRQIDYPASTLEPLFARCQFNDKAVMEYHNEGLVVLRATVMNPYIIASNQLVGQDFIQIFIEELDKAATNAFSSIKI
jgi:glutamate/tyrosine decarboxylase-like PLP-dependent enzyme